HLRLFCFTVFFFDDLSTTASYTLSLHDALPICCRSAPRIPKVCWRSSCAVSRNRRPRLGTCASSGDGTAYRSCLSPFKRFRSRKDRKSTRLNSSHLGISYAVFCLKKKIKTS